MAWIRWGFLLCACVFLSAVLVGASEKGRLRRRITYLLHPSRTGSSSSRRRSSAPLGGQQQPFNVELNARYSSGPLERTRRMSKPGSPSMQLRLGSSVQLHHKPGGPAAAFAQPTSRLVQRSSRQHQEPRGNSSSRPQLPQKHPLQGVNVCGGQCCHGWSKAPGFQRCTKRKTYKCRVGVRGVWGNPRPMEIFIR
uniref:Uncharacterized protein n=1 Tax=Pelusios castaneus TaxID=367368 RepID=A0A8C8RYD1_9SAUR